MRLGPARALGWAPTPPWLLKPHALSRRCDEAAHAQRLVDRFHATPLPSRSGTTAADRPRDSSPRSHTEAGNSIDWKIGARGRRRGDGLSERRGKTRSRPGRQLSASTSPGLVSQESPAESGLPADRNCCTVRPLSIELPAQSQRLSTGAVGIDGDWSLSRSGPSLRLC